MDALGLLYRINILDAVVTLFLFTKSDVKTTVVPVTLTAAALAPLNTPSHFLHSFFWVWLHVLQFNVSNQAINPLEDEHNKRDRPLPAQRISLEYTLILRWSLVPICWLLSACYNKQVLCASVGICLLTVLHNELSAHRHWVGKNVIVALGATTFEAGAILVTGDNREVMSRVAQLSLICSIGIFSTTIYAQDFKDVEGDALVGRKTVPIIYPALAAPALAFSILAWSAFLVHLWHVGYTIVFMFGGLAAITALSYLVSKSVLAYQYSYCFYNAWVTFALCLPLFQNRNLFVTP